MRLGTVVDMVAYYRITTRKVIPPCGDTEGRAGTVISTVGHRTVALIISVLMFGS